MLHAAETWAMNLDTLSRLRRNDRAMIRWICNVRAKDEVSSDSLLTKLGIQDLDVVLRTSRMGWFGHVERSTGWIAEVRKLNVVAQKRSGRPRKSWDEVLENDRKKLGMDSADPQNRAEWRGRLRERLVKKPNPRGKQASRKLLHIKVTPDLHLTYSKNGGKLWLVLKMKKIACISILITKHVKYTYLYLFKIDLYSILAFKAN